MKIWKDFTFDSAHWLPNVPKDHKCHRMHGHTYKLRVVLVGVPDRHSGMIMDYAAIKDVVDPIIKQLDHNTINDLIENPTTELVAEWLWKKIKPKIAELGELSLSESDSTGCSYAS